MKKLTSNTQSIDLMERELNIAMSMSHKHVVRCLEVSARRLRRALTTHYYRPVVPVARRHDQPTGAAICHGAGAARRSV